MNSFLNSTKLIYRSLRRFLSLSFIFASMVLMVRLYEFAIVSVVSAYPPGSSANLLVGLKYDLIFYLRASALLMIPFLIIAFFSQKAARNFFMVVAILITLTNMLLLQYFSASHVPLGADLLGYSWSEIRHTIGASGELRIVPIVLMVLYLALMTRIFIKHVYLRLKPVAVAILTLAMFASLFPIRQLEPQPSSFDNEFGMFLAYNKIDFFCQSVENHLLQQENLNKKAFTFKSEPQAAEGNPFTYVDPDYPFLHNETTPDVLGKYFNLGETPPNIVLIIVESLGRAYSGQNAYLGNFTPFLDSLEQKSLYWENCLSTSGRTFQVLPATLASLPFGDHGFAEMASQMPDHISLVSLLKKEANFESSFVYGGDAAFDNMDIFLKRQGIDKIIDKPEFNENYQKLPAMGNGFSWGFGDREIFSRYIEELKKADSTPRLDVLLTLAMHDPFLIPSQDKYIRQFQERLTKLGLSDEIQTFDHHYDQQFSTILYFDESLRYFFSQMSKLPGYNNTIFIITGDHRMPEIPISTQIDRFHVPLVIYSPLLKQAQKFSSLVTHFDITPSLVALLNEAKFIRRPSVASWIGHGLDPSVSFRSLQTYPLMRNKNEILDMLSAVHFLSDQTAYRIFPENLDIEPIDSTDVQHQLQEELNNFLRKNKYVCRNNRLIPDSLKKYEVMKKEVQAVAGN